MFGGGYWGAFTSVQREIKKCGLACFGISLYRQGDVLLWYFLTAERDARNAFWFRGGTVLFLGRGSVGWVHKERMWDVVTFFFDLETSVAMATEASGEVWQRHLALPWTGVVTPTQRSASGLTALPFSIALCQWKYCGASVWKSRETQSAFELKGEGQGCEQEIVIQPVSCIGCFFP